MSYDFHVFRPVPGRDPVEVFEELMEREESDDADGSVDPQLQQFAEYFDAQVGNDVCCNASPYMCEINITYAMDERESGRAFEKVLRCIQHGQETLGLLAFDPQTGEIVNPSRALEQCVKAAAPARQVVRELSERPGSTPASMPQRKKPWWRFW